MQSTLYKPDDSLRMQLAIKRLVNYGYAVSRKSPHQLKVGSLNFYPDRGTITQDGAKRIEQKGIDQFIALLKEHDPAEGLGLRSAKRENKEAYPTIVLSADSLPR